MVLIALDGEFQLFLGALPFLDDQASLTGNAGLQCKQIYTYGHDLSRGEGLQHTAQPFVLFKGDFAAGAVPGVLLGDPGQT